VSRPCARPRCLCCVCAAVQQGVLPRVCSIEAFARAVAPCLALSCLCRASTCCRRRGPSPVVYCAQTASLLAFVKCARPFLASLLLRRCEDASCGGLPRPVAGRGLSRVSDPAYRLRCCVLVLVEDRHRAELRAVGCATFSPVACVFACHRRSVNLPLLSGVSVVVVGSNLVTWHRCGSAPITSADGARSLWYAHGFSARDARLLHLRSLSAEGANGLRCAPLRTKS